MAPLMASGNLKRLIPRVIGIHGKRAPWCAHRGVCVIRFELHGIHFAELIARAENQHRRVEERR
jgi:hypothetical protein